jgi:hypothetical protein
MADVWFAPLPTSAHVHYNFILRVTYWLSKMVQYTERKKTREQEIYDITFVVEVRVENGQAGRQTDRRIGRFPHGMRVAGAWLTQSVCLPHKLQAEHRTACPFRQAYLSIANGVRDIKWRSLDCSLIRNRI